MYYIKSFLIFSLLGFIMESVVYKIGNSNCHSGILFGPYTLVYGLGGLATVIIYDLLNKITINNMLKIILLYLIFTIVCTLIEFLIGNLINIIFNIDKWNYTDHTYHFGKYICLDLALTWGVLSLFIVKYLRPFLDKLMELIPNNTTIFLFSILLIDLIYTLFIKAFK